jgi:hypothetical protein
VTHITPLPKWRSGRFLFSAWDYGLCVSTLLGRILKVCEQHGEGHPEGRSDFRNVLKTQIAFAALDGAHECPVNFTFVGEGFLGISLRQSQFPNTSPQRPEQT